VTVGDETLVTGPDGAYSGEFVAGEYTVEFEAPYFTPLTGMVTLLAGVPATLDVELVPVAPVVVQIAIEGDPEPDTSVTATAIVLVLDGSVVNGFEWMQASGAPVDLSGQGTDTVTLALGDLGAYKATLLQVLAEPPIGPDELPPNVPVPPEPFPAALQDRFQVVGLNPFTLERAGLVGLSVEVTTSSGVYAAEADLETHLPWKRTTGLRNVPINTPVLLHGKEQASYDWALDGPGNSSAVLMDAATRDPWFTPEVAGIYQVTVTDLQAGGQRTIEIFAGNWRGVVTGQDADGLPVADTDCTGCHSNLGFDKFAPWSQTGHARIFSDNLDASPYWGPQCFSCHTVGYDPGAANSGIDEMPDYQAFLASGMIGNPPGDDWSTMLQEFSWTAQLANVQCESCHGPQWGLAGVNSAAHGPVQPEGTPRMSISSDVCATCHGEPLRHARFQQWQLSAHADYPVAIDEGSSGNCSRCHTGNGFLTWLPVLLGDLPGNPLANITVSWTSDEVHPQTCVTCHDPHNTGTNSGDGTNAVVRISGDTPPLVAGFTAYDVGNGAICITCHNSRRGLRNDSTFAQYYGTTEAPRMPHNGAQGDVFMGQNAYLVEVGLPGDHVMLEDTCVRCHMEETPPPEGLSYNASGTNHTFYARPDICSSCHEGYDAKSVQVPIEDALHVLQGAVEEGLLDLIAEQNAAGYVVDLNGQAQIADPGEVLELEFTEASGQQAIIVTFLNGMTKGPYGMNNVRVYNGGMLLGRLYDFAEPALIKAGWNWGLIHNDGSLGVHNPGFATSVLDASIQALQGGG
jgi:hypothetical protein